jgi:hypothetical protein
MKRLVRQSLRVTGAVLGAFGAFILLEIVIQGFGGGGSHPMAGWAMAKMEKIFRPAGHWFVTAPDWAWISVIMVLGFPTAYLLTWSLNVASTGIRRSHRPRWMACIWIGLVFVVCACIRWVRMGSPF